MTDLRPTYQLAEAFPPAIPWPEYVARVQSEWTELMYGPGFNDERLLQEFLGLHPSMIPGGRSYPVSGHLPLFSAAITQPPLCGIGHHVPDFMWFAVDSGTLYPVFIEIETPGKRWFNAKGDPSADLTHAIRQLSDWQAWVKNPTNALLLRDRFRIPNDLWRTRDLHPQFVLVFGSRREFEQRDEPRKRRNALKASLSPDLYLLTFDRLVPDQVLDDTFCAHLGADGLEARTLSPALRLGPTLAQDLADLRGKESAVDRSAWISDARRSFLKARFSYWEEWAASGSRGIIRTGDRE